MSANLPSELQPASSKAPGLRIAPWMLDRIDQAIVLGLWIMLLDRTLRVVFGATDFTEIAARIANGQVEWNFGWLAVASEALMVVFVLIHRQTDNMSVRLGDWMLAITATAAPLLIQPNDTVTPIAPLGMVLVIFGNVLQLCGKLSLRRSFGIAPANRGVKVDGLYRYVRHPIYAGYLAMHIGLIILIPSVYNLAVYAIGWTAQILRLQAEEALLSHDPAYAELKQRTRYRLIPGIY